MPEGAGSQRPRSVVVCINLRLRADQPSCAARGSVAIAEALEQGLAERGVDVELERIRCLGECSKGPTVRLAPGGRFFLGIGLDDVPGVLDDIEQACAD